MTITFSPEIEQLLVEESTKLGTTPEELAGAVLQEKYGGGQKLPNAEIRNEETPEARRARIHALKGSMAHLGPSRILEDRAEDRIREEKHWQK